MIKRTTTGALLVIGALVAAACGPDGVLPSGPDFDAQFARGGNKAEKVDVCHVDDEGNVKKINVNGNAVAGHLGHDDGRPGDGTYDEDCQADTGPFVCSVEFTALSIELTSAGASISFSTITTGLVTYTVQWFANGAWQDGPFVQLTGSVSNQSISGFPPLIGFSYRILAECDEGGDPQPSGEVVLSFIF